MDILNTFFHQRGQNAKALDKYLLLEEIDVALFRINANDLSTKQ